MDLDNGSKIKRVMGKGQEYRIKRIQIIIITTTILILLVNNNTKNN